MKTSHLVLTALTLTTCLAGSARSQQANQTSSQFVATISNSTAAPKPPPEGMVWIPGGEFSMGAGMNGHGSCEMAMPSNDAEPIHRVRVDGFFMDKTAVTNEQFEEVRESNRLRNNRRTNADKGRISNCANGESGRGLGRLCADRSRSVA